MQRGTGKLLKLVKAMPLVVIDCMATCAAVIAAAWGTRELGEVLNGSGFAFSLMLLSAVNVVVFALARMYTTLWEYASVDELLRIVLAVTCGAVLGDALEALLFDFTLTAPTYISAWAILLVVCGASRFAIRMYSGAKAWSVFGVHEDATKPRSLIIGAGETGSLTTKRMLSDNPDMLGCPVAIVDDDKSKLGRYIHGIKVLGTCDDIPQLAQKLKCKQLVMAAPSASKQERDRIFKLCMSTGLKTLTLPNVHDLPQNYDGKIMLREVEISDLLAREEKELDLDQMGYITGKRVLVTGGGGSIGSELVRQLLPAKPAQVVLFDIYENTTYELYHEIHGKAAEDGIDIRAEIGSITNIPALETLFDTYNPQVVFHAAAHKHVPLMENNPREAIENNVFGTLNVVRLAHERGCTHFVQISTDKAVNPTNVMGATKRMDEMIVQYYASISDTVFTAVRFGNVLGSHGSVIPLFKRQMKEGGPITVTHRDITRYFMTIPEASRLVITAGALAKGGEIFVLDMGDPVKIWDLATQLIQLSGLKLGRDIEIVETGLRPGEKMYEELLMDSESLLPTTNKDIRISTGDRIDLDTVTSKLRTLEKCLDEENKSIKTALSLAVPTYHPQFAE
ncbi:MAG: polysaccharide biosynthesis protein [Eggerthellaceae bacterium]